MPPIVLTFAASDPTGGAGLQADILTFAALACHPLSVLTAFTVQDTSGVQQVETISSDLVTRQASRLLAETRVAAFKVGVLGSAENVRAVAAIARAHSHVPLVLDPVLASGRGDRLATDAARVALIEALVPCATVVTPNTLEAGQLGGVRALLERGCRYVLLTGTHADTADVVNTLHDAGGVLREDRWPRLAASYHGSGCTLAAALAARLALGDAGLQLLVPLEVGTWRTLSNAFSPGAGQAIPNRFFQR